MKRWLRSLSFLVIGTLAGCGASRDEGLISSTQIELASANSAMETMTTDLGEYMKLKEGNDTKAINDKKKALLDAADNFRQSAQKLQGLYRQAESAALKTPEERKKFREANKAKIDQYTQTISDLAETGRKFTVALDESTKKYDKDLTEVLKKLQDANMQFASLKPSTGRAR
jgi:mRNA-degrading endonuclease HigB of HigAB toxin-antitoxin module